MKIFGIHSFPQQIMRSKVLLSDVVSSYNFTTNLDLFVRINCLKCSRPLKRIIDSSMLRFFPGWYNFWHLSHNSSLIGRILCSQSRSSSSSSSSSSSLLNKWSPLSLIWRNFKIRVNWSRRMVLGNMAVWYSLLVDQTTWMFGFIKMYISKTKLKNCFISGMLTVCHKPVQVLLASSGLTARYCSASRLVSSIICVKNALVRYNWT